MERNKRNVCKTPLHSAFSGQSGGDGRNRLALCCNRPRKMGPERSDIRGGGREQTTSPRRVSCQHGHCPRLTQAAQRTQDTSAGAVLPVRGAGARHRASRLSSLSAEAPGIIGCSENHPPQSPFSQSPEHPLPQYADQALHDPIQQPLRLGIRAASGGKGGCCTLLFSPNPISKTCSASGQRLESKNS